MMVHKWGEIGNVWFINVHKSESMEVNICEYHLFLSLIPRVKSNPDFYGTITWKCPPVIKHGNGQSTIKSMIFLLKQLSG